MKDLELRPIKLVAIVCLLNFNSFAFSAQNRGPRDSLMMRFGAWVDDRFGDESKDYTRRSLARTLSLDSYRSRGVQKNVSPSRILHIATSVFPPIRSQDGITDLAAPISLVDEGISAVKVVQFADESPWIAIARNYRFDVSKLQGVIILGEKADSIRHDSLPLEVQHDIIIYDLHSGVSLTVATQGLVKDLRFIGGSLTYVDGGEIKIIFGLGKDTWSPAQFRYRVDLSVSTDKIGVTGWSDIFDKFLFASEYEDQRNSLGKSIIYNYFWKLDILGKQVVDKEPIWEIDGMITALSSRADYLFAAHISKVDEALATLITKRKIESGDTSTHKSPLSEIDSIDSLDNNGRYILVQNSMESIVLDTLEDKLLARLVRPKDGSGKASRIIVINGSGKGLAVTDGQMMTYSLATLIPETH